MQATEDKKCPQCGKTYAAEARNRRVIIMRGRNPRTNRAEAQKHEIEFCSALCGAHYQMGCEG